MLQAIIGITIGLIIGSAVPTVVMNAKISAVLIVVSLDAILGGTLAKLDNTFDDMMMISGFLLNTIAAVLLVFLGDYIGVNLYYFALFAAGLRIFKNLSILRRYFINKIRRNS